MKKSITLIITITIIMVIILRQPQANAQTGSTKVNLTLALHGIGTAGDNVSPGGSGNTNPLHPQRNVKVEIYNASNQLVSSPQGVVQYNTTSKKFSGTIDVGNIPSGVYQLRLIVSQYLIRRIPGIVSIISGNTHTIPEVSLITGDVNNDNFLNLLDFNVILDCFSDLSAPRNCSDPARKLAADITDDNKVNQNDYNLFLRELSVQPGEDITPPIQPTNPINSPTPPIAVQNLIPLVECDWFVAPTGSDGASGTSEQTPFRTVQRGVAQVGPGKALCIKGGTYKEIVRILGKNLGVSSPQKVKIGGYEGGGQVIIDGGNFSLPNPQCQTLDRYCAGGGAGRSTCRDNCIYEPLVLLGDSRMVELYSIEIKESSGRGLLVLKSEDILLRNVNTHGNWGGGIQIGLTKNSRIENSQTWDNVKAKPIKGLIGGGGAQIHESENVTWSRSSVYRNFGEGLNIGQGSNRILVEKSRFWENAHTALYGNDTGNTTFDSNFLFCTGQRVSWMKAAGDIPGEVSNGTAMTWRNESNIGGFDMGENNAVTNNVFAGCTVHLVFGGQQGTTVKPMLFANNTFVEARRSLEGANPKPPIVFDGASAGNYIGRSTFVNNIIQQTEDAKIITGGDTVDFSNNISTKPTGINGFTITDPRLKTQFSPSHLSNPFTATPLNYITTFGSPAINAGTTNLGGYTIFGQRGTVDLSGNLRNGIDIGAFEFGGAVNW